MNISEIFHSIQGEGINAGKPCVFLRTANCNLQCVWCDTKYTWLYSKRIYDAVEKEMKRLNIHESDLKIYDPESEIKSMTVNTAYKTITAFNAKHLVLTGGEPMIYNTDAGMIELLSMLKKDKWFVEIETNGTILPCLQFANLIDQWNVSLKLENSGNLDSIRKNHAAIKFYASLPSAYFKFVINARDDIREVINIADKYDIENGKIILMPQATTREDIDSRREWLIELCKEYNFIFSSRLHIEAWGSVRGK